MVVTSSEFSAQARQIGDKLNVKLGPQRNSVQVAVVLLPEALLVETSSGQVIQIADAFLFAPPDGVHEAVVVGL